jgi:NAD(P)-dependent dehydrogenase (short-subunit alcohol dehydrogenase family)
VRSNQPHTLYTDHEQASEAPAHLILAGRNPDKLQDSIKALKAEYPNVDYRTLKVDFGSQKSVRAAAEELLTKWTDISEINVMINSAGIMAIPERTLSVDGIEMHFATNHIGHFLLTSLLMPKLLKAAESNPKGSTRVINVTSLSPTWSKIRWSDPKFETTNKDLPEREQPVYQVMEAWGYEDPSDSKYIPLDGYDRSKVANLLFSIALTKRMASKGIVSMGVHPGVIMTELGRDFTPETFERVKGMLDSGAFPLKTQGAGSSTTVVAAFDPKLGAGNFEAKDGVQNWGSFLIDCQISDKANPLASSSEEAEKLWTYSEELVGQKFAW